MSAFGSHNNFTTIITFTTQSLSKFMKDIEFYIRLSGGVVYTVVSSINS